MAWGEGARLSWLDSILTRYAPEKPKLGEAKLLDRWMKLVEARGD